MPDAAGHRSITVAEARVLVLLLERRTPREAATLLGSSLATVRTHIKHLQTKSETHTIASLVLWGRDELIRGHVQLALRSDVRWFPRAVQLLTNH
ncbi:MAG: hypothetical protein O3A10_10130 [Chloroflexi bacterium]|nr:hypothetical protein [Chloroflexota bacterium]MDA1146513.1 hypothetical protein [Chloroflexota bacterium]